MFLRKILKRSFSILIYSILIISFILSFMPAGFIYAQGSADLTINPPLTELMEGNLNEAVLSAELADDTFADETIDPANIVLNNAPTGLTVEGVAYTDDTNIVIDLAFDGTDFDTDIADFSLTINAAELEGAEDITTNALDIFAIDEIATADLTINPPLTELMEGNLNEAVLSAELADDTFADETIDPANIVLNNAPTGLTVEGVAYTDDTNIVIDLAFDGTDFDTDIADFSLTINAAELEGAEDITTNALDIFAIDEIATADLTINPPLTELMEGNLNEAVLSAELTDDTFADETIDPANIVLNNAPTGLTVEGVAYTDDTNIVIDLAFDGTDFDTDIADFSLTINAAELEGAEDITTNALDIKALSEINHFEKDGHVVSGAYSLDVVDIIGADFGDDKGDGYVKFYNNQNAEVIEWTDAKITCRISSTMRTGFVTVTRDDGVPSNPVSFIVTTQSKPSAPVGSSPTSLISTDTPIITWSSTASSGAVGYEMQVTLNSDTGFVNPIIDEEIMAATSYTPLSPLDRGKAYIWRVRAFNIYIGYSSWSTVKSFSIRQLPNITSITPNPASGLSTSASNLVTITGTAFGSSRASTSFITFPTRAKGAFDRQS